MSFDEQTARQDVPLDPEDKPRASLIRSLVRTDFKMVFQPIVDLDACEVYGSEALVRCQQPGLESPAALFFSSSACGETGRLCRTIREATFDAVPTQRLFLNVHPEELEAPWIIRPDDPLCMFEGDLFLEITERTMINHFDLCSVVLKEICTRTGAKLVIDDLGAGYSNLRRLIDLEPAVVKLDMGLVRSLDTDERKQILVRHLVALCRDLGATVVAEGIETNDELLAVIDCGVRFGQGFYLARPGAPMPDVAWLADGSRTA